MTMDHVKPCLKVMEAIASFPVLTNIHNACPWFGLQSLQHLLQPDTPFYLEQPNK